MKTLLFAQRFPKHHPRSGDFTMFDIKLLKSLKPKEYENFNVIAKHNTIRAGNNYKVGDVFEAREWSAFAYRSKHNLIIKDVEVKKVWHFDINEQGQWLINGKQINFTTLLKLANNDGFENFADLQNWFCNHATFSGQIICWNENVSYEPLKKKEVFD